MGKQKVVICNPISNPGVQIEGVIPYNLLMLAVPLLQHGFEVELFDLNYHDETDRIVQATAGAVCVGISAMTGHQIKSGLRLAGRIREAYPDLPLVWGGPHPSILPEQTLAHPLVDFVVIGQGTYTFLELVQCLAARDSVHNVPGLGYKRNQTSIINARRPFSRTNNLTGYPFQLLPLDEQLNKWNYVIYNSSEGCPWRCGYCANQVMYERKWHGLEVDQILHDLKYLCQNKPNMIIDFVDTNFFVDPRRSLQFARTLIDQGLQVQWTANGRVDQFLRFSADELRRLRDSGFYRAVIGFESGSQRILDMINKDIKVDLYKRLMDVMDQYDILVVGNFMFGIPTETAEDLETSRTMIREFLAYKKCELIFPIYVPYPGSQLYEMALAHGFNPPDNFEKWGNFTQDSVNTPWLADDYEFNHDKFVVDVYFDPREIDQRIIEIAGLIKRQGHKNVLIWGAGLTGRQAAYTVEQNHLTILGFTDSSRKKWHRNWFGHTIYPATEVPWKTVDAVFIASRGYQKDILDQIRSNRDYTGEVYSIPGKR